MKVNDNIKGKDEESESEIYVPVRKEYEDRKGEL